MAISRICSIPGCGKLHYAKDLCDPHYKRLLRHGNPLGGKTDRGAAIRFYDEKVRSYGGDDCLIWPYDRRDTGYGSMSHNGKTVLVSRRICEEVNGPPPAPNHEAAHSCGKGHLGCVTKGHLSWKTSKENKADKLAHDTHDRGERNSQAKITESVALEIIALRGKESQSSIARRFGIVQQQVSRIQRGERWAWLPERKSD